jgi:hypothetical protein
MKIYLLKQDVSRTVSVLLFFMVLNIFVVKAQWQKTNGITTDKIHTMIMNNSTFFVGTDTGGVYKSSDNGLNWTPTNIGLGNKNVKSLVVHRNRIIAGIGNGFGGAVFLSDDNGSNWKTPKTTYYGYLFCMVTKSSDVLAGTWYGVAKSTDTGSSWSTMSTTGLPSNAGVNAIVADGNGIYAGVSSSSVGGTGVFFSANGNSWSGKNTGLTNTVILSMARLNNNVFAGTQGGGIFKTVNKGTNWSPVNTGLSGFSINTIVTHGTDVFIGTNSGIYKSADSGTNWNNIGDTTLNAPVYAISFMGNYIFAGTNAGLWRRPLSQVTSIDPLSADNIHIDIYPNPGTGVFRIGSDAVLADLDISVINMQGQKVYNGTLQEGWQGYELDLSTLPKGVYMLAIQTLEGITHKKVILED